jgi:intein/homing endonuclease
VKTEDGFKSIETIQTGDIVASANEHTGEISYKRVVQTFIRQTPRIYKLTYNDGTSVETTGDHPFFIQGKGWTNADSLSNGDVSPTWAGVKKSGGVVEKEIVFSEQQDIISDRVSSLVMKESLAVVDIEVIEEETTVYNFEVEDDHTYFVTDAEVWVHNADKSYSMKADNVS